MKKSIVVSIILAALAGCANQPQQAAQLWGEYLTDVPSPGRPIAYTQPLQISRPTDE